MWNSFDTFATGGMTARTTTMTGGGGKEIHTYIAQPDGDGPYPGVVLLHHVPGWDEFYREFARRFAQHGFIAICPNLYERYGHGTPDDVAAAALYLCSDAAGWVTGKLLEVDGGWTFELLPRTIPDL